MKNIKNQSYKVLIIWGVFILLGVLFLRVYELKRNLQVKDFNYPKFLQALEDKHIQADSVVFNLTQKKITGKLNEEGQKLYAGEVFDIEGNVDDKGFELVREFGITPSYSNTDRSFWASLFLNWLPLIIFAGIFIFFIRQLQVGGGKALAFGKSRARLQIDKGKTTFKDVAGVEEAKEELKEIVEFLRHPKKFTRLGGKIPKGVLLIGPPGTGKTLLAKAVAGEANVPFFTISGSDFVEMFVGVGASRVRDLFAQGKKQAPCLIFIDEIDAVGRHRGAGLGGGHDEREQTLNQLLVEMDGFESKEGIILMAATNRPDVLDPALLRPGRFDRRVVVNAPDLNGRAKILEVHTKKVPVAEDVQLKIIARGTPGFSGADLANLVNEACLRAARKNQKQVLMEHLEYAKDKVMMGAERRSMVISEKDKKIIAYHEAGHTIVGKTLEGMDPIHKVTIIPRGMALGLTQTLPEDEALNLSKSKATNMLAFLLGGRSAEELIFKDYTTGAGNDIERATELARRMVCEWGMSEKLGVVSLERRGNPVFVGMQSQSAGKEYSESKATEIDSEVDRLLTEAHKIAFDILSEKESILHAMSQALLEYETIDGEEVELLMKGMSLEDLKKHKTKSSTKETADKESSTSKKKSTSMPDPVMA
ncbi:MAG: ATP-dependent zinc metalloprotease FtsH [Bdellovibrionales bacterium]|nr:ATP-dependent zinc metalloprotease FtsH [Bdellovibrionales bacterium]